MSYKQKRSILEELSINRFKYISNDYKLKEEIYERIVKGNAVDTLMNPDFSWIKSKEPDRFSYGNSFESMKMFLRTRA